MSRAAAESPQGGDSPGARRSAYTAVWRWEYPHPGVSPGSGRVRLPSYVLVGRRARFGLLRETQRDGDREKENGLGPVTVSEEGRITRGCTAHRPPIHVLRASIAPGGAIQRLMVAIYIQRRRQEGPLRRHSALREGHGSSERCRVRPGIKSDARGGKGGRSSTATDTGTDGINNCEWVCRRACK